MTALQADLSDVLSLDFSLACRELGRARQKQREKDTPDHRAAVAECLARIDTHLDMWLDLHPDHSPALDRAAARLTVLP